MLHEGEGRLEAPGRAGDDLIRGCGEQRRGGGGRGAASESLMTAIVSFAMVGSGHVVRADWVHGRG